MYVRAKVQAFVLKLNNKKIIAFLASFFGQVSGNTGGTCPRTVSREQSVVLTLWATCQLQGFLPSPMATGCPSSNGSFIFCYQVYHIKIIITFLKSQAKNALQGEVCTNCLFILLNLEGKLKKESS